MQDRNNRVPAPPTEKTIAWPLIGHFFAGAGLGSLLALILMNTHRLFVDLVAASPSPVMCSIGLVATSASIIGVGSAITGALFSVLDES